VQGKEHAEGQSPKQGCRCVEQLRVEVVEDRGLIIMVEKRAPTIKEHSDLVNTQAGRGTRVEESGVVIS
jgi:hypothetical protein